MLNSIGDIQTIITCTGLEEFVNNRFEINRIFKVSDAKVSDAVVESVKTLHDEDRQFMENGG